MLSAQSSKQATSTGNEKQGVNHGRSVGWKLYRGAGSFSLSQGFCEKRQAVRKIGVCSGKSSFAHLTNADEAPPPRHMPSHTHSDTVCAAVKYVVEEKDDKCF